MTPATAANPTSEIRLTPAADSTSPPQQKRREKSKKRTTNKIGLTDSGSFTVPLNMLDDDPDNPRRTGREDGIDELAASIAAHGLLQQIGVIPQVDDTGEPTGRYRVRFGGRRLAALRLLAKRKGIEKTADIPCRPLTPQEAAEAALAENVQRRAMHPVDEFQAWSALHDNGKGPSIEKIAQRFGATAHMVRQRLRLAAVSPVLLDQFKAGKLTLEQIMAFAVTDDHAAQEQVFETLPGYYRDASHIRQQLTRADVLATDRRALFVSVAAYEAAGGGIKRDLFSDDRGGWLTDPPLLDRLVVEKLAQQAEVIRAEGWAWVEAVSSLPPDFHAYRAVTPRSAPLSKDDEARLQELSERRDALEAEMGDGELTDEQESALAGIEEEIETLTDRAVAYRPEDMARAGVFVTLGYDGVQVRRGVLRPGAPDMAHREGHIDDEEDGGDEGDRPRTNTDDAKPSERKPTISGALASELAAHRTAGLQAEVASQPHLALCLLIDGLASRYSTSTCRVHITQPPLHAARSDIEDTEARKALGAAEESTIRPMPTGNALLPWLVAQNTDVLLGILAPLVARGVDGGSGNWIGQTGAPTGPAQAAQIASLDMRKWWQATTDSYFSRVPKALIADAVREGAGAEVAASIEGMKKAPMAEAAARLLDGKGWLPPSLRAPTVSSPVDP